MPAVMTLSAMRDMSGANQNDTGLFPISGPRNMIVRTARALIVKMEDKIDGLKVGLHLTKDLPLALTNRRMQNQQQKQQRQRKKEPGPGENGRSEWPKRWRRGSVFNNWGIM